MKFSERVLKEGCIQYFVSVLLSVFLNVKGKESNYLKSNFSHGHWDCAFSVLLLILSKDNLSYSTFLHPNFEILIILLHSHDSVTLLVLVFLLVLLLLLVLTMTLIVPSVQNDSG